MESSVTHHIPISSLRRCELCLGFGSLAGSLELYSDQTWQFDVCDSCFDSVKMLVAQKYTTARGGGVVMVFHDSEDIDVAAHHDECMCVECTTDWDSYEPDADELVKFWKENRDEDRPQITERVA